MSTSGADQFEWGQLLITSRGTDVLGTRLACMKPLRKPTVKIISFASWPTLMPATGARMARISGDGGRVIRPNRPFESDIARGFEDRDRVVLPPSGKVPRTAIGGERRDLNRQPCYCFQ